MSEFKHRENIKNELIISILTFPYETEQINATHHKREAQNHTANHVKVNAKNYTARKFKSDLKNIKKNK